MVTNYIYDKYQKSQDYIRAKALVSKTNKNWDFYIGDQWRGMANSQELPILNFIKPIIKYKVSTIAQHVMTANFSDARSDVDNQRLFDTMNTKFSQSWEKSKMNTNAWIAIKNAAIEGDTYMYFAGGDTNRPPQVLDNTAVRLGDENTSKIQEQPYIIIVERLPVKQVRKIAEENKISKENIELIVADSDTKDQIVNSKEISDKVTSFLYFEKQNGIVCMARATKTCVYEELKPMQGMINGEPQGGAKMYPIVNFIWEPKPNSARGISEVEALIPNQIELNKTLARRAMTVKIAAFPRLVYNKYAVEDPDSLEKVGAKVAVNGTTESISQAVGYINATNISSDADKLCSDLLVTTKELAGAGDTATGNINPERASGEAILAVRDQSQVPLNEQVNLYSQLVEDIALVWFDKWVTFQPDDFKTTTNKTDNMGNPALDENGEAIEIDVSVDYDTLIDLEPSIRIDVSQDNPWTKMAEQQQLDNLLQNEHISFDEYVEALPSTASLPKGKLLAIIEKRASQPQDDTMQAMQPNTVNQDIQ